MGCFFRFIGVALGLFIWPRAGILPWAKGESDSDRFAQWEPEIKAFAAQDAKRAPVQGSVVFVGSSSIRLWKSLETDFPELPVLNRGFGGSQIVDSQHFADRIIVPYSPRVVVMYSGGNDIHAGETPETVARRFREWVGHVRMHLPSVRIVYISIAPNPARWSEVDRVRQANQSIQEFCRARSDVTFLDIFSAMLGTDGQPRPELYVDDRLHMSPAGYALWTRLLRPVLLP